MAAARDQVDLWIEVGAGSVLTALAGELVDAPVVAMEAGGRSRKGLLRAFAAAFELGAPVDCEALFAGRFVRPFVGLPRFFSNPCEMAPVPALDEACADSILSCEGADPLELVRRLVAERTELPLSAIQPGQRLLSDLHLNSITVAQLVVEAARQRGLAPLVAPLRFADATVAEIARVLENAPAIVAEEAVPAGVDSWVRAFHVELAPRALTKQAVAVGVAGAWRCFVSPDHPFAIALPQIVPQLPAGGGILLCLPSEAREESIPPMLEAARAAAHRDLFVMVQCGGGASLARTLHRETGITTCVVDVPFDHPQAPQWIAAEALAAKGYSEAHYDAEGRRYEPVLRLQEPSAARANADPDSTGVLLVTGGGKGIAAECALALARETGVKLALLGRSEPSADAELAANLERMRAAGVRVHYAAADVADGAAVAAAFREIESSLGPVTAILHGAGINTPCLLAALDEAAFRATVTPKVQGLRNLLRAADPARLRLLVAFGSIIARTGLEGEADYAVANEWMARDVERWGADHAHCRCLTIEWSVWSGIGMGRRLGRIDELMRQGITPITPEEGVRVLKDLLSRETPASLVVTGRFGDPPTLRLDRPELPFARFLERPRLHYPGVELIADAELSTRTDPYLSDHIFQGTPLLPAVMGLEAMAQVAAALCGANRPPVFEDVRSRGRFTFRRAARSPCAWLRWRVRPA
jgi:enediyne polyketide synthase